MGESLDVCLIVVILLFSIICMHTLLHKEQEYVSWEIPFFYIKWSGLWHVLYQLYSFVHLSQAHQKSVFNYIIILNLTNSILHYQLPILTSVTKRSTSLVNCWNWPVKFKRHSSLPILKSGLTSCTGLEIKLYILLHHNLFFSNQPKI